MTDSENPEHPLPFRIDGPAAIVGEYFVLDAKHKLVKHFDDWNEALAFVAEANGCDPREVERATDDHARLAAEYLHNLRTGKKSV